MKEEKIAPGISILGFDNPEEFTSYLEQQQEQEQRRLEQATPEQKQITWGARVIYLIEGLAIFGHIYTEEEFLIDEGFDEATDEDEAEIMVLLGQLRENHDRGRRYGIWYSAQFPEGEFGSHSVADLWEIPLADFEEAQKNGWIPSLTLIERVYDQIAQASGRTEEQ